MTIHKHFINDKGRDVWFDRVEDEATGQLRYQKQTVVLDDSYMRKTEYSFYPYDEDDDPCETPFSERKLYHVTWEDNLENICVEGIKAQVGGYYGNHWIGAHGIEEIREYLCPGVFLTFDEPINGWPVKTGCPVIEINANDLNMKLVMADSEIKNSIFYAGSIDASIIRVIK